MQSPLLYALHSTDPSVSVMLQSSSSNAVTAKSESKLSKLMNLSFRRVI